MEEEKIKRLRREIEIGEESGFVLNFDYEDHLAELQKERTT